MHILTSLPNDLFQADVFIQGSRKRLDKVIELIAFHLDFNAGRDFNPSDEWRAFAELAPKTDNVNDYLSWKGLHCPLAEVLLGYEKCASSYSSSIESRIPMVHTIAGNSVAW